MSLSSLSGDGDQSGENNCKIFCPGHMGVFRSWYRPILGIYDLLMTLFLKRSVDLKKSES